MPDVDDKKVSEIKIIKSGEQIKNEIKGKTIALAKEIKREVLKDVETLTNYDVNRIYVEEADLTSKDLDRLTQMGFNEVEEGAQETPENIPTLTAHDLERLSKMGYIEAKKDAVIKDVPEVSPAITSEDLIIMDFAGADNKALD